MRRGSRYQDSSQEKAIGASVWPLAGLQTFITLGIFPPAPPSLFHCFCSEEIWDIPNSFLNDLLSVSLTVRPLLVTETAAHKDEHIVCPRSFVFSYISPPHFHFMHITVLFYSRCVEFLSAVGRFPLGFCSLKRHCWKTAGARECGHASLIEQLRPHRTWSGIMKIPEKQENNLKKENQAILFCCCFFCFLAHWKDLRMLNIYIHNKFPPRLCILFPSVR